MDCRAGCGACCIAPSINTPMPSMPFGKAAGERCLHLDENNLCKLFAGELRPAFCAAFAASREICGESSEEALQILNLLELQTSVD